MKSNIFSAIIKIATLVAAFNANNCMAISNDPCGCNAGLVQEVQKHSKSSQVTLSFLQQIDETQYEKIKREGGASATILDIVGASANYRDFSEKRNKYISNTDFKLDSTQAENFFLSTVKTHDWASCKKQCIENQPGFYCGTTDFTPSLAIVHCSYRPEGEAKKKQIEIVADGISISPFNIEPNTTREWQFSRTSTRDLVLTFTPNGGSSKTVIIPATPPMKTVIVAPKACLSPTVGSDLGYPSGRANVDFDGNGCLDYCRIVGNQGGFRLLCNLAPREGEAPSDVLSAPLDRGYEGFQFWVDVNADKMADFCRVVGNNSSHKMQCTLSNGKSFGVTYTFPSAIDRGYPEGAEWQDVNADGMPDYCRYVGNSNSRFRRCLLSNGTGFYSER